MVRSNCVAIRTRTRCGTHRRLDSSQKFNLRKQKPVRVSSGRIPSLSTATQLPCTTATRILLTFILVSSLYAETICCLLRFRLEPMLRLHCIPLLPIKIEHACPQDQLVICVAVQNRSAGNAQDANHLNPQTSESSDI